MFCDLNDREAVFVSTINAIQNFVSPGFSCFSTQPCFQSDPVIVQIKRPRVLNN
jgi:hypothetical protein